MSFGDVGPSDNFGRSNRGGFGGVNTYQNPSDDNEHDRLITVLTNNVQQIQYNVNRLNKMVQQLGTDKDTQEHRNKIRSTVESTGDIAKDTNAAFKKVAHLKTDNPSRARLTQDKLRKDFELWLKEFQDVSKLSVAKERESAPRPSDDASIFRGIGNEGLTTTPGGEYLTEEDQAAADRQRAADLRRQEFQQLEQKRELEQSFIQERDQGIRNIEASVVQVNEIFADLATLVEEQGDMIDSIEANIVHTEEKVSQGTTELRKASDYQKSARNKLCYLLLCILILGGVVAALIFILK